MEAPQTGEAPRGAGLGAQGILALSAARTRARRARSASASGLSRLVHAWRRSLQFRVVTMTMLLGLLVLLVVGSYLYQQIGNGLVEARRTVATAEALQLTKTAQVHFRATDKVQDADEITLAARTIVQEAAGTEQTRFVVLARLAGNTKAVVIPTIASGELGLDAIPEALRAQVAADRTTQALQIVPVKITGQPDQVPCWVVGQQVDLPLAGGYGIYYVYPMERERETLGVVGRTFLFGGLVLMLLIGAVAYVVTRLVVAPVRRAAEVAQRFASGRLDERMASRGEDDLASLATSFNAMAEGLQHQIAALEDLSRVQQRFVSDVSHELRTPLTTIRMAGDVIYDSRAQLDPLVSRSAELLRGEVDRFEELLADLLEIGRFDAGAAILDAELTDLRRTVVKVVDGVQALAQRRGSRVTVIDPGEPCLAMYDPRRVERILRNLLVNAIEHGEGKPIEIRVGKNERAVAAAVRDHGVGLRPGEAGMVFDRFWRADPARARTTGGTGLGLAISLEDARLHDGWLQAWGAPGEGSCFRLTLPRRPGVEIESAPVPLNPDREAEGDRSADPAPAQRAVAPEPSS
jgi:two-component system sensor histidine kinase MtrB